MTPKLKAVKLIDKFTYWNTAEAEREGIKSALSVVDEILKEENKFMQTQSQHQFWTEVKTETNKL